jgi:molecular chaperone DnaK
MAYRLGVDIGTTYTAAAVFSNGATEILGLGNRAMQIPSVLYLRPEGGFLVGEAAEARSAAEPDRVVREFKRRLGDPVPILVAGSPFSAEALIARLLSYVVGVATERQGEPPESITVAHPANWGAYKQGLLRQAFLLADLTNVQTCTEPEAAAITYASRQRVDDGACIAVYDLGGGTFDAAVLRNNAGQFTGLGTPEGIEHLGGVDFDEAVFQHVLRSVGIDLRSLNPEDPQVVFALDRLRRDCVVAKESLSTDTEAVLPVTVGTVNTTVRLTRSDLEDMLRAPLEETIGAMRRVLQSAEVEPDAVSAIVLVGGSSRIPLVSELLVGAFRRPLAMDTHPKHDIALGAALIGAADAAPPPAGPPPPSDPSTAAAAEPEPEAQPARPTDARRSSRRGVLVAGILVVLLLAAVGVLALTGAGSSTNAGVGTTAKTSSSASGSASGPISSAPVTSGSPTVSTSTAVVPPPLAALGKNVLVWSSRVVDPASKTQTQNLWSMTTTGGARHELIANVPLGALNYHPSVSHNRKTIAYVHQDPGSTVPQVHLMRSDGTHDHPLFATPPAACPASKRPAFSPDDSMLVVPCLMNNQQVQLRLVTLAGKIVGQPLAVGLIGEPTFNAAGTKIAFRRQPGNAPKKSHIAEINASGHGTELAVSKGSHDNYPQFSPTPNDTIAYNTGGTKTTHIRLVRAGADSTQLTHGSIEQSPTWSPDGTHIAYVSGPDSDTAIVSLDLATGKSTRVRAPGLYSGTTVVWAAR